MIEEWKLIEGFPEYMVSNFGRVKTLSKLIIRRNGRNFLAKERVLKPCPARREYLKVGLVKNHKYHSRPIHRLVASAFLPNPENKPQVNHRDFDASNNHVSNLEWCTGAENREHYYKFGVRVDPPN